MPPVTPVKILFVGDMHLGRRASRIPDQAVEMGRFTLRDVSPVGAWRQVVQTALEREVQAVALAGDLVHQDDDLFEARAHLEHGIHHLNEAGITVIAVAGNHDTRVLPALASVIDGLHLLGPDGTWSTHVVAPGVQIVGWSFPARHHTTSPLQDGAPPAASGTVTLGLLHADLGAVRSNYAPVSRTELDSAGYQGWALGHIHAPDPVPGPDDPRRPFYLGSITGAIPTETGAHGPVLATVATTGEVTWERLVMAPLRWEHRTVPADGLVLGGEARDHAAELRNHVFEKIAALEIGPEWSQQPARALGLRLTLTGTHTEADAVQRAAANIDREDLVTLSDNRVVFIEKLTSEVTVPLDLAVLARRSDPPGLVAREILALRAEDPAADALLAQARHKVAQISPPAGLEHETWTDSDLRDQLIKAGQHALNALLSQERGPSS